MIGIIIIIINKIVIVTIWSRTKWGQLMGPLQKQRTANNN